MKIWNLVSELVVESIEQDKISITYSTRFDSLTRNYSVNWSRCYDEGTFLFCFVYNLMYQKVKRIENIDRSVSSELNKSISFMMHICAEPNGPPERMRTRGLVLTLLWQIFNPIPIIGPIYTLQISLSPSNVLTFRWTWSPTGSEQLGGWHLPSTQCSAVQWWNMINNIDFRFDMVF